MGHRDMSDGTWAYDHEHSCPGCGETFGCDGCVECGEGAWGRCEWADEVCTMCEGDEEPENE